MRIQTKITLLAVCPVLLALGAAVFTLLVQQRSLDQKVAETVREQAFSEAGKVAQSVYWSCVSTERSNEKRLTHDLTIAGEIVRKAGGISLGDKLVSWNAVNQFSKEVVSVSLPQMMAGSNWLGQVTTTSEPALLVDEATHLTGDFCTIFQRMNESGDMLRVCTTVKKDDATRALGTFIPAKNPDGTANDVIQAVLKGGKYRGRAYVVNEWHATAYEPIWDPGRNRIIGMLYCGVGMGTINKELHDSITEMGVGRSGYVYVIGAKGDERGKYIVSFKGQRDGENIWNAQDASGSFFVQSILEKGVKTRGGSLDREVYPWKNSGESQARMKIAAITYYEPWGWIIGAGAYEEDFADVRNAMKRAHLHMAFWVSGIAAGTTLLAAILGMIISRGLARPITRVISELCESSSQINDAASHVSSASQALAESSSEEAASLEETSASLEELSSITQRNTENAQRTDNVAKQTRLAADRSVSDMQALTAAMEAIQRSSDDIAKILKVINEIAFQTNILALNAAVEAARAGEAGMGFAVVAGEVRNLAQRSGQAARETAEKIENAIRNTNRGVELSANVGRALNEIAAKARQVDELAAEVAQASHEQTQGITQINGAVGQIDRVTQSNAASAEQSAAAAEELRSQALLMERSVQALLQLVGERKREDAPPDSVDSAPASTRPAPVRGRSPNRTSKAAPAPSATRRSRLPAETGIQNF
jgi:methyl-accepting chemotaxis protein